MAPGLTLTPDQDGRLIFRDAAGIEVARLADPYAMDSTPDMLGLGSGRTTSAVGYALTGTGSPWTLSVSVDPTWLQTAVYPVYVDPTIVNGGTSTYGDTFSNQGDATRNYANFCRSDSPYYCEMWLGQSPSPTTDIGRDFIRFDLSTIAGTIIDSASLQVFPYHQYYGATPKTVWVREVAATWTEGGLTYNNEPASIAGAAITGTTAEGSWSDIGVTGMVRDWIYGYQSNHGLKLDENGNNYTYWKRLIGSEEASYVHPPKLVVTNHTDSVAPTGSLAVAPLSGVAPIPGTATDDALMTKYVVEYGAGLSPSTWILVDAAHPFYTTPVTAASATVPLATWDTTALQGVYTVRLRVSDAATTTTVTQAVYVENGMRGSEPWLTRIPFDLGGGWNLGVGAHNGELTLDRDLFSIPSYGPSQALSLSYSSKNASSAGRFGNGWSSNLTQWLDFDSGLVVWNAADGTRVPFDLIGSTWTPLLGRFETMSHDGTAHTYTITEPDQSQFVFADASPGRLKSIKDRYGNALTFVWNTSSATATDASARATTMTIDSANNRITAVSDSAGRAWGLCLHQRRADLGDGSGQRGHDPRLYQRRSDQREPRSHPQRLQPDDPLGGCLFGRQGVDGHRPDRSRQLADPARHLHLRHRPDHGGPRDGHGERQHSLNRLRL